MKSCIGQLGLRGKTGPSFPAAHTCCRTSRGGRTANCTGMVGLLLADGTSQATAPGCWSMKGGGGMASTTGWEDLRIGPRQCNLTAHEHCHRKLGG